MPSEPNDERENTGGLRPQGAGHGQHEDSRGWQVGDGLPQPAGKGWHEDSAGPQDAEGVPPSPRPEEERRRRETPGGGWLPGERELDQGEPRDLPDEHKVRKEWKITVRLSFAQFQRVATAAELYGVRPTTMARMLINRGSNAIVNAYRRDELGLGRKD